MTYDETRDKIAAAREQQLALAVQRNEEARSALKELVELCEFATFESRDVDSHEFDALVEHTLTRARRVLRVKP